MFSVVQAQKLYMGDEVGLDVYHCLLWGNKILYCSIIKWFDRVGTGVKKNTNAHPQKSITMLLATLLSLSTLVARRTSILSDQ